jgi:chorismate mutase
MRLLDRALTSPHHLTIFAGGHVWLSSDLAIEAVEWIELQAMTKGLKPRDDKTIDQIFAKRTAAVDAVAVDKATFLAVQAIVADFEGLRDVSALAARAVVLGRDRSVRDALRKDRDDDAREERMLEDVRSAETRLASEDDRARVLLELRQRWKELSDKAKRPDDSSERQLARRALDTESPCPVSVDQLTLPPVQLSAKERA